MLEREQPNSLPPQKGFLPRIAEAMRRVIRRPKGEPQLNTGVQEEGLSISRPIFIPDPTLEEIHSAPNELGDVQAINEPDPSLEEIIRRATQRRQTPPEENTRT